jgi:hypothetical protein
MGERMSNARKIKRVGMKMGANPKQMLAAIEAGLVESNLRDLPYGDRDSVGVFQQRPSQGWGPPGEGVKKDARQFFKAAMGVNAKGMTAGQLAQAVQRSAFPERYDERKGQAQNVLAKLGGGDTSGQPLTDNITMQRRQVLNKAKYEEARRRSVAGSLLAQHRPDSVAARVLGTEAPDPQDFMDEELVRNRVRNRGSSPDQSQATGIAGDPDATVKMYSKLAHRLGLETTSGKRDIVHTSSGNVSDHYRGNRDANARDWAGPPQAMEELARRIAKRLGVEDYEPGQISNVNRDGLRYQLIYGTPDHQDHVHLGAARVPRKRKK